MPSPVHSIQNPKLSDVVDWMVKFAHKGKVDMRVRVLVEELCRQVESGDYASEALAIYYWVDRHIRYMRDIQNVEFLKEPGELVSGARTGDCDDIATLIAAMLLACGNECVFSLVSFNPAKVPSHVFCCVRTAEGLIALDPVARFQTTRMLKDITARWDIPV